MNIVQLFIDRSKETPNRVALVDNKKEVTYGELKELVFSTIDQFVNQGVSEGDRIMVVIPISIDTYRIVLSLWYIGAVPVFMEEWAFRNHFHKHKTLLDCNGVVLSQKIKWLTFFRSDFKSIPLHLSSKIYRTTHCPIYPVHSSPESAIISLTSGSSGRPKIADRSHVFLEEQFTALSRIDDLSGGEVVLVGLPTVVFYYLGKGATIVLRDKKTLKEKNLTKKLSRYQITHITDSPSYLLGYQSCFSAKQTSRVLKIVTGGGPVFDTDIKELMNRFRGATLKVVYGSTEVEPISVREVSPNTSFDKKESTGLYVGKIDANTHIKIGDFSILDSHQINDSDFNNCLFSNNKIGEIVVSGSHVLNDYFNSESIYKAQKLEVNGTIWHKTGDSGFVENGDLFLTGPIKQLIERNGQTISPFIVESYLSTVPFVEKGTVLSIDNKIWLLLVLKPKQKFNLDSLKLDFDVDKVKIIKKMPLDARHQTKIDYKKLEKLIS